MEGKDVVVWVRISEEADKAIEAKAADKQVSKAAVIRWAIQEYLDKQAAKEEYERMEGRRQDAILTDARVTHEAHL